MKCCLPNSNRRELHWLKYVGRFFEQRAETCLKVWRLLQFGPEHLWASVQWPPLTVLSLDSGLQVKRVGRKVSVWEDLVHQRMGIILM